MHVRNRFPLALVGALGILIALVVTACGGDPTATPTSAPPTQAPQATQPGPTPTPSQLDNIIAAARQEGEVEVWINWDEATVKALQDKWQQDFGWPITITSVPMPASGMASRVIQETQAGQKVGDVGQPSTGLLSQMIEAGAVEKTDWSGIFGSKFPGITEAEDVFFSELSGYALHFWDVLYEFTYNKNLVSRSEVPTTWQGLTDPKWKGKIAVDARGFPFNFFMHSPDWDEAKVLALVDGIRKNEPVLPAASRGQEVIAGEVAIQIGGCNGQDIAKGAPIDCIYPDYLLFNPLLATVPKNAKHPNIAKLFAAWLVTDGFGVYSANEYNSRVSNPESDLAKSIAAQRAEGRQITLVEQKSFDDVAKDRALQAKIAEIWAGIKG